MKVNKKVDDYLKRYIRDDEKEDTMNKMPLPEASASTGSTTIGTATSTITFTDNKKYGWVCGICNRSNSPWVTTCPCWGMGNYPYYPTYPYPNYPYYPYNPWVSPWYTNTTGPTCCTDTANDPLKRPSTDSTFAGY
jgi:hypothetical protein